MRPPAPPRTSNAKTSSARRARSASNFVFSILNADLPRGVVASSGNHAQAVAIAARYVGIPATLIMPEARARNATAQGANIITYDRRVKAAKQSAIAGETGAARPRSTTGAIAGQAPPLDFDDAETSMLSSRPWAGGLLEAIAAKAVNPSIRIFAAEPETANDTYLSIEAGRRIEIPDPDTIADGLRSHQPGVITFPILQRLVEKVLLVSEREIRETVKFLLARLKILVEPSGAVPAAAVLYRRLPPGVRRIGVVLSGGNVDFEIARHVRARRRRGCPYSFHGLDTVVKVLVRVLVVRDSLGLRVPVEMERVSSAMLASSAKEFERCPVSMSQEALARFTQSTKLRIWRPVRSPPRRGNFIWSGSVRNSGFWNCPPRAGRIT
jgi:threonine dehydratase